MRLQAFALCAALMLMAGCAENAPDEPPAQAPISADEPAEADGLVVEAETAPPVVASVPVVWSGRLEAGVRVCEQQTPSCHAVRSGAEDQERVLEGERGRVLGGGVNVTWEAQSALAQELRAVVVTDTPGCGECEDVLLGWALGASPLAVTIEPMPRALGEGEVIRVYVRSAHAVLQPPIYVQADPAQPFDVEGSIDIQRPMADA